MLFLLSIILRCLPCLKMRLRLRLRMRKSPSQLKSKSVLNLNLNLSLSFLPHTDYTGLYSLSRDSPFSTENHPSPQAYRFSSSWGGLQIQSRTYHTPPVLPSSQLTRWL